VGVASCVRAEAERSRWTVGSYFGEDERLGPLSFPVPDTHDPLSSFFFICPHSSARCPTRITTAAADNSPTTPLLVLPRARADTTPSSLSRRIKARRKAMASHTGSQRTGSLLTAVSIKANHLRSLSTFSNKRRIQEEELDCVRVWQECACAVARKKFAATVSSEVGDESDDEWMECFLWSRQDTFGLGFPRSNLRDSDMNAHISSLCTFWTCVCVT